MNQYIEINYKPKNWQLWFYVDYKTHREKAPSCLNSSGYWYWYFQGWRRNYGIEFDWKS